MKVKVKGLVFAGLAAVIFAGNAHAALQPGDLDPETNPTHVTAKSYVDRVVNSTAGTLNDLTTTQKGNLVAAINEVNTAATSAATAGQPKSTADFQIGTTGGQWRAMTAAEQAALGSGIDSTKVGQIATNTSNIATNASNIATNTSAIGTLTNLDTTDKTDLVAAINEVNTTATNAGTAAISGLDYNGASGTGVVKQVTQTDGIVAATISPVTNEDIASNAAIAQSKIANLTSGCSEQAPCAWINNVWVPIQQ